MEVITRKSDLRIELEACISAYSESLERCVSVVHDRILMRKVKFPLLEFCAEELSSTLSEEEQLPFCDAIHKLGTEGGNVVLGKMLQLRMHEDFERSIEKAVEYIAVADVWYVPDIIGERVFGHALLTNTDAALKNFIRLKEHPVNWVIRAWGAGAHFAVKRGLSSEQCERLFEQLLSLASHSNREVRAGIGWAAKTTAKFHPEIIQANRKRIDDPSLTDNWFRNKVAIGLARNTHAKGN